MINPNTLPTWIMWFGLSLFGRSVIIGFQKTQIYQRFAGSRQEVFILKIQNDENNAAQQDNGRRFNMGTELMLETL